MEKSRRISVAHILLIAAILLLIGTIVAQFANQAADDYIAAVDEQIEKYEGG